MSRFPTLIAILLSAFALTQIGCKPETLTIGVVLPLSGPDQAAGEAALHGLELALEGINTPENERLELIVRDSGSDPDEAARLLNTLFKEEHAVAAIGGLTPFEARALADVAESEEKVLILPSAGDQRLSEGSKHIYRLSVSNAESGSKLAAFAKKNRVDSAMVLAEDERFGETVSEGFRPTFENLKGEYLGEVSASATGEDLSSALEQIQEKSPKAVVVSGGGPWLEAAIKRLRDGQYRGKILTPQSFSSPVTLAAMGKSAKGVLFTYSPIDPNRESGQGFVQRFESSFGEAPSLYAAEAFDSLHVLAKAAEGRPAIASEIRRGLRDKIKDFQGVTGSIEFDDTGAVPKYPRIYSLSNSLKMRDHEDLITELEKQRAERIKEIENRIKKITAQ